MDYPPQPYVTIRTRRPADGVSMSSGDSAVRAAVRGQSHLMKADHGGRPGLTMPLNQYGSSLGDERMPMPAPMTHDITRTNYHVKHLSDFAKSLENSAARAFPNHGRSQRYQKVQSLLLHWKCDDLFVLPELEDLEQCLREDYNFETDIFAIPSENSHLELMMRIGTLIKAHESNDTLFVLYYGGHARIDESRQSTWCATRHTDSPWLQWSAIQTLLERSLSDVLILLDCCAGAASATFPTGNSITETISASSWDAIAPDPGRYSFTTALIEVLQEWRNRTYSAAMLHAEILARLKHPRPIMHNGKHFEARSTPVHFMMTSNHKAPSIEMCRVLPDDQRPPSPPEEPLLHSPLHSPIRSTLPSGRSTGPPGIIGSSPNEDTPHVMISLALEDDQHLDLQAWESWLAGFPALAKYVKVQGVFKSHSTLLLMSLPVMVWDLLPENLACNFIAFIRSNNLAIPGNREPDATRVGAPSDLPTLPEDAEDEPTNSDKPPPVPPKEVPDSPASNDAPVAKLDVDSKNLPSLPIKTAPSPPPSQPQYKSLIDLDLAEFPPKPFRPNTANLISRSQSTKCVPTTKKAPEILLQHRKTSQTFNPNVSAGTSAANPATPVREMPPCPEFAPDVQARLEEYFQSNPRPIVSVREFLASTLNVESSDIDLWFQHRREQHQIAERLRSLQSLKINDQRHETRHNDLCTILPGHLNRLLEIFQFKSLLIVDLRPPANYEKSHIHGAINFRVPTSFVKRATMEMIEQTFEDDSHRAIFNNWYTRKCIVFYARHIESASECPSAEALLQRFKSKGWGGHGFMLKGHFREFSHSFDRYVTGHRMSEEAKAYRQSLEMPPEKFPPDRRKEEHKKYKQWLRTIEEENRAPSTDLVLAAKVERERAMLQQQEELEEEFKKRTAPGVYEKAMEMQPNAGWNLKAPMVEHLSRGLDKMQEAAATSGLGNGTSKASSSKLHDKLPDYEPSQMPGLPDYPGNTEGENSHKVQESTFDVEDEADSNELTYQAADGSGMDPRRARGRNLFGKLFSGR